MYAGNSAPSSPRISASFVPHNCIATADRVVVVFIKEFQWDQRPDHLKTDSFPLTQNYYVYFLFLAIPGDESQLFLITFSVQNIRGAIYPSGSRVSKSGRCRQSCERSNLLKSFFLFQIWSTGLPQRRRLPL